MKKYRHILFFVFFASPLFFAGFSYASAEEAGKFGGVIILLQEKLKAPFQLSSYKVLIDGKTVLEKRPGDVGLSGITINRLPEGRYKINVSALYTGSGYGLFDYHEDYRYPVESSTEVMVREGRVTNIKIVCNDRDGFLTDLGKRPYITYNLSSIESPKVVDGKETESVSAETATGAEQAIKEVGITEEEIKEEEKKDAPEIDLPLDVIMARHITGLNIEKDDKFKLVIMADGAMNDYLTGKIDKPDRIVIDIKDVKEQLKTDTLEVNGALVKKVRVGQHPGYTRIVLDTPGQSKLAYDVKPAGNALIVTVSGNSGEDKTAKDKTIYREAKHLTGISVERVEKGVKVFLGGDGSFGSYKSQLMEKPDRLVIDIKGVKELLDLDELTVNSTLLKAVRVGQHPGMLRLVLDLSAGARVNFDVQALSDGLLVEILDN